MFKEESKVGDLGRSTCAAIDSQYNLMPYSGDLSYAPFEILYNQPLSDSQEQFFATDCYLLGSLITFYIAGISMTALITEYIRKNNISLHGNFISDLPYLQHAFNDVIGRLELSIPIIEQIINKPDNRYDTFLANILTSQLTIPNEIRIVTWNYDSQFEIAYKEYLDDKLDKDLTTNLRLISRGDSIPPFFNPSIFKINGSATFREMRSLGAFCGKGADQELTESILIELLNYYVISLDKDNNSCKLSFAWEDDSEKNKQYWLNLKGNTQDAVSLVVIGYTFPFFNRNIDRTLFDAMKNLKTIYIQDPNAENLIQNIRPVLSDRHSQTKIIPLTNVDQFYLPAELSI